MAHFAQLDENNIVVEVVVIANDDLLDENGIEQESLGVALCQRLFGKTTRWAQTSYNANLRKNYAIIGMVYDAERDVFRYTAGPYPSWVLNDDDDWVAPVPHPGDHEKYRWDEEQQAWVNPAPYPSWTFTDDFKWVPPVARPQDGNIYSWDEEQLQWVFVMEDPRLTQPE